MSTIRNAPRASATVNGTTRALEDGDLALDSSRYPYAQGRVSLPLPPRTVLDGMKVGQRLTLTGTEGGHDIVADLTLTSREVSHDSKKLSLTAASDEVLLENFAQPFDDPTPRQHQASLRQLVGYVLGKAIPGAVLQPSAIDADVTAQWDVTNEITNPRGAVTADDWRAGSGVTNIARQVMASPLPRVGTTAIRMTTAAGVANLIPNAGNIRVTPGRTYLFAFDIVPSVAGRTCRAAIQWWAAGGLKPMSQTFSEQTTLPTGQFSRYFVIGTAPEGAETALPYVATSGNAAGNFHYVSLAHWSETTEDVPYFDGATPADARYAYAWQAEANDSASVRRASPERLPEMFIWRAGDTAWEFLAPLTAAAGLRLYCDESRRWHLIRPDEFTTPGRISARPDNTVVGVDVIDLADPDAGFTGVVVRYTWETSQGDQRTASDAAGSPGKIKVLEVQSPPIPGLPGQHLKKIQGQIRQQKVTTFADYSARPGMEVQIDLPDTEPQVGTVIAVTFELANGLMHITSGSLRETPIGSIDLLNGSIDAQPGTIDDL